MEMTADILGVKNFVEITLSCSVSMINMFLHFTQKFKMAAKMAKNDFWKKQSDACQYPGGKKFCRNRSISHNFQDKCIFAFYTEFQDDCQKWRENDFLNKLADNSTETLRVKNFVNIALSQCF